MDNFCRACGKSIPRYPEDDSKYEVTKDDLLCPVCLIEYERQAKGNQDGHVGYDDLQFTAFCLNEQMQQKDFVLQKVLDEKANLFMENLHLKEEIRQLVSGKGEEILNTMREKMEALSKGYEELNKRTMGLATYGGPKSNA